MSLRSSSLHLPAGYARIQLVGSFEELIATPLEGGIHALCWERSLSGDFREIVEALGPGEGIVPVDEARLGALTLSEAGQAALQRHLAAQVGRTLSGLVEKGGIARAEDFTEIAFSGEAEVGGIVMLKVTGVEAGRLTAELT